jgi:Spy/CpxP family protein refolding chaperone
MRFAKGALIASAVAAMMSTVGCAEEDDKTAEPTAAAAQKIKCEGANECKGQGACQGKSPDGKEHSCQGQNECKGQGWIELGSEKECTDKGGTVLKG